MLCCRVFGGFFFFFWKFGFSASTFLMVIDNNSRWVISPIYMQNEDRLRAASWRNWMLLDLDAQALGVLGGDFDVI